MKQTSDWLIGGTAGETIGAGAGLSVSGGSIRIPIRNGRTDTRVVYKGGGGGIGIGPEVKASAFKNLPTILKNVRSGAKNKGNYGFALAGDKMKGDGTFVYRMPGMPMPKSPSDFNGTIYVTSIGISLGAEASGGCVMWLGRPTSNWRAAGALLFPALAVKYLALFWGTAWTLSVGAGAGAMFFQGKVSPVVEAGSGGYSQRQPVCSVN